MAQATLDVMWLMLPGQRPWRELHWLSLMPDARVTAVGNPQPPEAVRFVGRPYRQPTDRFVEAGALAWLRDLGSVPDRHDWVASLELCSLVTGQASRLARRRRCRQAVLVWANDPDTPLYRLPPYRQALRRARAADLFVCLIEAARDHCLALGLPPERCPVVYPGVDTELFHPTATPVTEPVAAFVEGTHGDFEIASMVAKERVHIRDRKREMVQFVALTVSAVPTPRRVSIQLEARATAGRLQHGDLLTCFSNLRPPHHEHVTS